MAFKRSRKSRRALESNRNSRIVSRVNSRRTTVTKAVNRDPGTLVVEVTSKQQGSGRSRLFIQDGFSGEYLALNGSEMRTLYRVLQRHYESTDRVL